MSPKKVALYGLSFQGWRFLGRRQAPTFPACRPFRMQTLSTRRYRLSPFSLRSGFSWFERHFRHWHSPEKAFQMGVAAGQASAACNLVRGRVVTGGSPLAGPRATSAPRLLHSSGTGKDQHSSCATQQFRKVRADSGYAESVRFFYRYLTSVPR